MPPGPSDQISTAELLDRLTRVETVLEDLTITERINTCAYMIAAYICSNAPPSQRDAAAQNACIALRQVYVPEMSALIDTVAANPARTTHAAPKAAQ